MDLYRDAARLPSTVRGRATVVTAAQCAAAGITPAKARWLTNHGRIIRAHRGIYLLGIREPDLLDRARAARLACSRGTVVGFHTAAALLGFGVVEDHGTVHMVAAPGYRFPQRHGIRVHRRIPVVREAVRVRGVLCTPAARTAIDLARTLPRSLALATLDCALANGACTHDSLVAEVARHQGLPGCRQARELVAKADGRSQCTQETQLRLVIHDAGLLGFVPQVAVRDNGIKKYVLDLADERHRVAAEYDGISHDDPRRRHRDRERHNWLDGHGWRMRYFTDVDLYRRPWKIVRDLRNALEANAPNAR